MGKTVFFVRHAKSSWSNPSLDDFDRPLNKRGLRDAPFMAQLLREQINAVDALVASPANRTMLTAGYFAKAFDIAKKDIVPASKIYEAFPEDVLEVVQGFQPEWNTVIVFGHNPAFSMLANMFSEEPIINVPTCGILKVEAPRDDWTLFEPSFARLTSFQYPKQYFS